MNSWDTLSSLFTGETSVDGIPEDAADNVLIAWPPVIEVIRSAFGVTHGLRILDFGCGAGDFSRELVSMSHAVTGYDPSVKMLETARVRTEGAVVLLDSDQLLADKTIYDVVTAIMVFQFIEDIECTILDLLARLRPGGLLVTVTFNPPFITNLLREKKVFRDFDSVEHPRQGMMELVNGVSVPVFIRSAEEYEIMMRSANYREICRMMPPFNPTFLARYPVGFNVEDSEFLVQGFLVQP